MTSPFDGICERNRDRQAMNARDAAARTTAYPTRVTYPHPRLPDPARFSAALEDFTVQQIEATVAEWQKS